MCYFPSPILPSAGILSAIFDHDMANIDMANNITMYGNILSDHKSVKNYGN